MAGYKIQLKDKNGNRQYPVTSTEVVVDADGVSVADLLDRKQPTLVSGVNIKTVNGKTLLGEGDLVIEGGTADLSGYATEEYVDAKVGESYPIYYSYDGTPLTEEQKAANKMAVDKYVADESIILYPYNSSVGHPFDVVLTLSGGVWETAELTNYIFAYFNDDGTTMHYVKVTVEQDGDVQVEFSAQSPLVLASKAYVDSKVGGGSGETAESDVICVVWDDDTSDIPSNKEAYQKLAECCETVGKPAAVMVCVETGYRWGIEHFYWKTRFEDIELVTPVRNDGMYAIFTLTSEGVCTADFKQVSLGGGASGLDYNIVTMYAPLIDDTTDEVVTCDEALAEIENNFGEDVGISQEIKDAVSAFVISMKEHNASEYARARQMTENGEKVMVLLKGYEYPMLLLALYLLNISLGNEPPVTPEEFVSEFNAITQLEEMIFPEGYIVGNIEGEFGIEVSYDRYKLQPDENGEWTITSTESVRKYAILYYEGTARLTAQQCETNLKSKGNRLNNCDFQVNRCMGDGWSDNEDVLIIGKTTKTVSDFVNLNGDVVTCGVTAFRYIEDTKLIELQVSNEDGYCRKVELGNVVASGSSEDGGLKYFVERYVYEGKTEEEKTYNLESLAMLDEGADILWAGNGPQPNYEGAMWHMRYEEGYFVYNATAEINAETGVLETHNATFLRDFCLGNVYKEYVKAFFAEEQCIYERAFYQGQPIISWFEETNTTVRAYFIANGLVYSYVLINVETGEVSEPVIVQ